MLLSCESYICVEFVVGRLKVFVVSMEIEILDKIVAFRTKVVQSTLHFAGFLHTVLLFMEENDYLLVFYAFSVMSYVWSS